MKTEYPSCPVDYSRYRTGYASGKRTKAYNAWCSMRARCLNPNVKHYPSYGGRGVLICKAWDSFDQFFRDMGPCPPGKSLDKDILGDRDSLLYSPDTCMWATPLEQNQHTRQCVMLTLNGVTQCISAWSRQLSIDPKTITTRLNKGLPIEDVLSTTSLRGKHPFKSMSNIYKRTNGRYTVQMLTKGKQIKRTFNTLDEAKEFRDFLYTQNQT